MKIHIAKEGDSLYSLSQRYSVELDKIAAANPHIADPMRVEPGAKVKVPTGPVAPKVEAMAEKPKVEAMAEKPMVEAAAEKPMVQAAAEKPMVEAAAEKPKVEAAAEKKPKTDFEAETYSPLSQPAVKAPEAFSAPMPNILGAAEEKKKPMESAAMPVVNFSPMPGVSPLAETPAPMGNIPSPTSMLPLSSLPSAPYLPPNMEHMMPMAETMQTMPMEHMPMNQMKPMGQMPMEHMMPMGQMPMEHMMPMGQMPMEHMMPMGQMPMNQMMPMGQMPMEHMMPMGQMPMEHMMPMGQMPMNQMMPLSQMPINNMPMMPMSQMMAPTMPITNENPAQIQGAAAEKHPSAFKTNMQQSAYSPLHVAVPGVEEEAVHPFAQYPAPAVEAGGYMNPFGQPYPSFPVGMGPVDQGVYPGSAASPYGVAPTAPLMPAAGFPAYPAAYPGAMPYPAYGMPMHDCGCGGMRTRPPLPYALPRSDEGTQESASVNGFPAESRSEETKTEFQEDDKKAMSPKARKDASVSSRRETVRKFLSTRKTKSKPVRRENRPWIYN